MNFWDLLCTFGIHHTPDEKKRWTVVGWFGYCTRCGVKRTGVR
jgi:hypothetical protein